MIILKQNQIDDMIKKSLEALPNEACGLLAGRKVDDKRYIEKVYFLKNIDESPEHFSMDPKEQFAAIKDMREHGWEMIGNYHSHPSTPSRPSEEDKRLAYDKEASYVILSLQDKNNPTIKSFRIIDHVVKEETVTKA